MSVDAGLKPILDALHSALRGRQAALPPGVPDLRAGAARLAEGIPALTGEPLIGWADLIRNGKTVAYALARTEVTSAAILVMESLEREGDRLDWEAISDAVQAGAWSVILDLAPRLGLDPEMTVTLLDYAARPALRAGAVAIQPLLAQVRWIRGSCPGCGAPPALSVVSGKEHERQLQCGRCGTGWPFPRVQCPACGERSHQKLGNLHLSGEGEYRRVEVCDSCRGYVKSIAMLDLPDPDRLLELDLETAALDFLAVEEGYSRAPAR